jgi:sterol 14-demethylase
MGNAFALLQVKAILAILLRRYTFELVEPRVESDFHGLVVGPREPCRVRYRRRQTATVAKTNGASAAVAAAPHDGGASVRLAEPHTETPAKLYRVSVDLDLCQSHGVCATEAPEVFRVDGLTKVTLLQASPDASLSTKVEAAAQYCPTKTISIEER